MPEGLPIHSLGTTWGGWGRRALGLRAWPFRLPLHSLVGSGAVGGGAFG